MAKVAASVEVKRRVYVPASGRFARYLEVVRNIANEPRTIDVRIDGRFAASGTPQILVTPSTTLNQFAVTSGGSELNPVVAHVFSGQGGQAPSVYFAEGDTFFSYVWSVTLQPGQTSAFLHYSLQRPFDDGPGAAALAQALANLSDPEALVELDPRERGQIVNFVVPGGVTLPVGTISGQVLTAGGAPVAGAHVYAIDDETRLIQAQIMTGPDGRFSLAGLSSFEGIAVTALSPADPLVEATEFIVFTANGQHVTGVTLRFPN